MNESTRNIANKQRFEIRNSNKISSSCGTITIKPLRIRHGDQMKIIINNINENTTTAEIQNNLANAFEKYDDKLSNDNIKWHTNKINIDPKNHRTTKATLIAILQQCVNIHELIKHTVIFLENKQIEAQWIRRRRAERAHKKDKSCTGKQTTRSTTTQRHTLHE